MLRKVVIVFILGMSLSMGSAAAHAFLFGVIGDSLSTCGNADDVCGNPVDCLNQMGTDDALSFAHGKEPWSLLNRLKKVQPNLSAAKSVAVNGSRWDDALEQAQVLMQTPHVRIVHIEMGGNDVCATNLPTLAEVEAEMDATFTYLTDQLVNSAIIVSQVPDVVRVRDLMKDRPHFLFDSFQDLWDLETHHLRSSAVEEICEELVDKLDFFNVGLFGDYFCDSLRFDEVTEYILETIGDEFVDQTGAKFPCNAVLGSGATDAARDAAHQLNSGINALLVEKARQYDGRNDNAVFVADNIGAAEFTVQEVSQLDGFHLGTAGQEWLSGLIWDSIADQFEVPPAGYKQLSGTVSNNGTPVCALVLANGQYRYSCDGEGSFKMWVPPDSSGDVTLMVFAHGFQSRRLVGKAEEFQDIAIELQRPDWSRMLEVVPMVVSSTAGRVTISGSVSYMGVPVCALMLANGEHMFSCGASLGLFSLEVPLDAQGKVRLFGFASGFPPWVQDF